jgi:tetratricopeptide (TPR) repeat protein
MLCLLGAARIAGAQGLPGKGDRWLDVRTENFRIFSEVSEKRSAALAQELEQFRSVLYGKVLNVEPVASVPLYVFVFENTASAARYKPEIARAAFRADHLGHYIVLNATPSAVTSMNPRRQQLNPYAHYPFHDAYHEYVHHALEERFARLPSWVNEGIAEYFSTFRTKKNTAEIGMPLQQMVSSLRRDWIPFSELMTATAPHNDLREMYFFYSQSWALVHYVMHGNPERRLDFVEYIEALQGGTEMNRAFRDSFAASYVELEAETKRYVNGEGLHYATVQLDALGAPTEHEASRMSYAEVLYRLGDLLGPRGLDPARAEAHFRRAIEVDPDYGPAHFGLARLYDGRGERAEARAAYLRAIELDPKNYLHQLGYGLNRLANFIADDALEEARAAFSEAIRLRPGVAESYVGFGLVYLLQPEYARGGQAALRKAWHLLPGRMDIPYTLCLLELRAGKECGVTDLLEPALAIDAGSFLGLLARDSVALVRPDVQAAPYRKQVLQLLGASEGFARHEALREILERHPETAHTLDDLRLVRESLEAIALLDGEDSGRARGMLEHVRETAHRADLQGAAAAWLATVE